MLLAAFSAWIPDCLAAPSTEDRCQERAADLDEKKKTVGYIQIGSVGYCTAVLLSPRVALTAAHCVAGNEFRKILFSTRENISNETPGASKVIGIRMHPDFSTLVTPGKARADLALLHLDKPALPLNVRRFYHLTNTQPETTASKVVLIGYGIDGRGVQGVRREKRVQISANPGQSPSHPNIARVLPGEFGEYPCKGDSGAPLLKLVGNRMSVVGVYSWQTQFSKPTTEESEPGDVGASQYECRTSIAAFATLLAPYQAWIHTQAKQLDPDYLSCER
jgi:secreted trypsin-like serine protease